MDTSTTDKAATIRLAVKVIPSSSQDCIAGWLGETLKLRVRAPAERGRANAAVEKILSAALGVPARIVTGRLSARKTVEIAGMTAADIRRRLSLATESKRSRRNSTS